MSDGFSFFDSENIPWRASTVAPGVEVKDLGSVNGRSMQLVRCAPGAKFPQHVHAGPEFVFMLQGDAIQAGQNLGPGWASAAATDTVDEAFHSPQGCMFLTVYSD